MTGTDVSGNPVHEAYDYEAFGAPLAPADGDRSLTAYAFTGQLRDPLTALQYHRARWLDTSIGRWMSTDPVFDFPFNFANEYSYVGLNPIIGKDLLGTFTLIEKVIVVAIVGALVGIASNGIINLYMGKDFFENAGQAALFGALFAALGVAVYSAAFLIIAATIGSTSAAGWAAVFTLLIYNLPLYVFSTAESFANANTEKEIHVATAVAIIGFVGLVVGVRASARGIRAKAPKTVTAPKRKRLPQDVQGSTKGAPARKPWRGRKVGRNSTNNKMAQAQAQQAQAKGATDIRIDQAQVDIHGNKVGINRPDLQYTLKGKRYYFEYESAASSRGPTHAGHILANDPTGVVTVCKDGSVIISQ